MPELRTDDEFSSEVLLDGPLRSASALEAGRGVRVLLLSGGSEERSSSSVWAPRSGVTGVIYRPSVNPGTEPRIHKLFIQSSRRIAAVSSLRVHDPEGAM